MIRPSSTGTIPKSIAQQLTGRGSGAPILSAARAAVLSRQHMLFRQSAHSIAAVAPTIRASAARRTVPAQSVILAARGAGMQSRMFSNTRTRQDKDQKERDEKENEKEGERDEPKKAQSLGARLKALSKQYGYAALAVYLGLSAIDLPLCFFAVVTLGTDRIGEWEDAAIRWVKRMAGKVMPGVTGGPTEGSETGTVESISSAVGDVVDGKTTIEEAIPPMVEHQIEAAMTGDQAAVIQDLAKGSKKETSLWTQLVLAYAIHKSLIFIRVPLTAAVLPKVVRFLQRWGWKVGKK